MALGKVLGSLPAVHSVPDPNGSSRSLATSLWMLWVKAGAGTVPTPTLWLCSAAGCYLQPSGPGCQLPDEADSQERALLLPSCTSGVCSNKGTSSWMQPK